MSNVFMIPADVVWTFLGLRIKTWLIILAVLLVVLITRAILKSMKKAQEAAGVGEKLEKDVSAAKETLEAQAAAAEKILAEEAAEEKPGEEK